MNKSTSLFMLSSMVALSGSVDAWSKNNPLNPSDEANQTVVATDNRNGLLEVDYLFWKPYLDELNYSTKGVSTIDGTAIYFKMSPKTPDFDLSSGVRVGIGGYTSDVWDIKLKGTYYYTDAKSSAHAIPDSNETIFPEIFTAFLGEEGTKTSAIWRLNFGLLDFTMGREFAVSPKFNVHPYIGVRGVWINQKMVYKFLGELEATNPPDPIADTKSRLRNNIWGVGPRFGLDLSFYFTKQWSFRGGFSSSLVYGKFHVKQRAYTQVTRESGFNSQSIPHLKKSDHFIRSNVDAYFGIGWDRWFNSNKNRVYIALLCESTYWYQINQWFDADLGQVGSAPSISTLSLQKRDGDLGLFGGTLHFQVDF